MPVVDGYEIEVRSTFDGLEEIWKRLAAEALRVPIFLTWEWVTTWWAHYGKNAEPYVLTAQDASGEIVALAPWMIDSPPIAGAPVKRLAFVGTGVVYPAHLDIIACPGHEARAAAAFAEVLAARTDEWDVIEWISLRADSPLIAEDLVEGAARGEGATMPCPYAYLPEDWDTYAETYLSSKTQKNLAYYQRRLEREFPGEVAYEIASSREQSDETLNALRRMHESRWTAQGASTPFTSERFVAFHRDVAAALLEQGLLRLFRLRVREEIIAVNYCYSFGGVLHGYQKGFDEHWGRYSPGQMLQKHVIASAIQESLCEMDMLHGAHGHKSTWVGAMRNDRQVRYAHGLKGQTWLLGAKVFDSAVTVGRRVLSESVRAKLNRVRSGMMKT